MPAYWLTFKPIGELPRGWPPEKLQALVDRFEIDPSSATEWWRISSHRSAQIGDRVYLFKQGRERGIFGVGNIIDGPELREDTHEEDGLQYRALIRFEALVNPQTQFLLPFSEIEDIVPLTLIDAMASGNSVPPEVAEVLERRLDKSLSKFRSPLGPDQSDDAAFDPDSLTDERQRALRAIRVRRGQPAFRKALLDAYSGRCAVTGCSIEDVLEAAHITPYLGRLTNDVRNGLLLRADIHTLFDCGLLSIHPDTRTVVIADALRASSYSSVEGRRLRATRNLAEGPSKKNLQRNYASFQAQHSRRSCASQKRDEEKEKPSSRDVKIPDEAG